MIILSFFIGVWATILVVRWSNRKVKKYGGIKGCKHLDWCLKCKENLK